MTTLPEGPGPALPRQRLRHPAALTVAAALMAAGALVATSALVAGLGHPGSAAPAPPTVRPVVTTPDLSSIGNQTSAAQVAAGRRLVRLLQRGPSAQDRSTFVAAVAGSPRGRRTAAAAWHAWRALNVRELRLRWLRPAPSRRHGPSAVDTAQTLTGLVAASWTQPGWRAPATTALRVTVAVTRESGAPRGRLVELSAATGRTAAPLPVWAMGSVDVRTSGSDPVVSELAGAMAGSAVAARLPRLVRQARSEVSALLPRRGAVSVLLPGRSGTFRDLLGRAGSGTHHGPVAAVTRSASSSVRADAPMQIVLDPSVIGRLRPTALRVVLTHEMTHAATGAKVVALPLWIAEGFADLVALDAAGIAPLRAAGRALAQVRRTGPPHELPARTDFDPATARAARSYELAWLAFRTLQRRAGTATTRDFYRAVVRGQAVPVALRRETDLGVQRLVHAWRADLSRLARAAR